MLSDADNVNTIQMDRHTNIPIYLSMYVHWMYYIPIVLHIWSNANNADTIMNFNCYMNINLHLKIVHTKNMSIG